MKVFLYIQREYLKFVLLSLSGLAGLYMIIQITDMLGVLNRGGATLTESLAFFYSGIPPSFTYLIPLSALIGTNLTFIFLNRHGEMVALKGAGIDARLFLLPLLPGALTLSILLFLNDNFLAPGCYYRRNEILERVKYGKKILREERGDWFYTGSSFIRIEEIDPGTERVIGVTLFDMDRNFRPRKRIDARGGVLKRKEVWNLDHAKEILVGKGEELKVRSYPSLDVAISESPSSLALSTGRPEEISLLKLKRLIRGRSEAGFAYLKELVTYHSRFAYPFLCLLLPLLAFPFAVAGHRWGIGNTVNLLAGTLIGLFAYLVFSVGLALGKKGEFPPLLSAWGGNILFLAAGVVNFMKKR